MAKKAAAVVEVEAAVETENTTETTNVVELEAPEKKARKTRNMGTLLVAVASSGWEGDEEVNHLVPVKGLTFAKTVDAEKWISEQEDGEVYSIIRYMKTMTSRKVQRVETVEVELHF